MFVFLRDFFSKFKRHWGILLKDRSFRISFYFGLILIISSHVLNNFVGVYNDSQTYLSVGDVILDVLPTYDLGFIYTWGMYVLIFLIYFYAIFIKPEIVPFAMKTFAMLMFLRSGFILMTNIGPPADSFYLSTETLGGHAVANFLFKNDLFFSGHTAYPFLAFLIFKETKLRWVFFWGSIVMGLAVLLMHVHYSIDVFAAFFIAYGTYAFSDRVFNRLTMRFRNKIRIYGWEVLQKRLRSLKEKAKRLKGAL